MIYVCAFVLFILGDGFGVLQWFHTFVVVFGFGFGLSVLLWLCLLFSVGEFLFA